MGIFSKARMGGGQVHETNWRVWGVDLVEENGWSWGNGQPTHPTSTRNEPFVSYKGFD